MVTAPTHPLRSAPNFQRTKSRLLQILSTTKLADRCSAICSWIFGSPGLVSLCLAFSHPIFIANRMVPVFFCASGHRGLCIAAHDDRLSSSPLPAPSRVTAPVDTGDHLGVSSPRPVSGTFCLGPVDDLGGRRDVYNMKENVCCCPSG